MSDAEESESTTKPLHKWAELVLRELKPGLLTKAPGSLAGGLESLPREMNELTVFPCAGDGQASGDGHGVPCKLNKKAPHLTEVKQGARRPRPGYGATDGRQVANE